MTSTVRDICTFAVYFSVLDVFVASLLFMKGISCSWANTILVIRIYLLYLKTVLIIARPGITM